VACGRGNSPGEGKLEEGKLSALMHDLEAEVMRGSVLDTKKRIRRAGPGHVRRFWRRSASCRRTPRLGAVYRGADPGGWCRKRWAPAGTSSSSTAGKAPTSRTSCCTNISAFRWARRGAHVGPRDGAKSVIGSSLACRSSDAAEEGGIPLHAAVVAGDHGSPNGSFLDGDVCGTSLALIDAGVPITRPIAGIAMGLILEGEPLPRCFLRHIGATRIQSRRHGFQGGGHEMGVTSLQMDIKIAGITEEIMRVALDQAKGAAAHPGRN